jgi:hypothetical protein
MMMMMTSDPRLWVLSGKSPLCPVIGRDEHVIGVLSCQHAYFVVTGHNHNLIAQDICGACRR